MAVSSEPRRVVIFGATSGIAQAVAREYARRGARLVLVARAPERLAAVADPLLSRATWEANFVSAASLAERVAERMAEAKHGVLGLLSSVAGERGRADNYVYGASKAALTAYASGLGHRLRGTGVKVVTVKPGPVDTPMTARRTIRSGLLADVDVVGASIHQALERGERVVYVPRKWRWIMAVIRSLPLRLFERLKVR